MGVHHFVFSPTAAVHGNPERVSAREDPALVQRRGRQPARPHRADVALPWAAPR
jgi:hypothetical protein